ncbi:MAG: DUF3284 domain-containing protein [Bulleidia sp.]|nr:DUF3284 domain-containing protein [Bulleidia sp.]
MAQYESDLKVSAEEMMDFLIQQSIAEIDAHTGKKPSEKNIEQGYRYTYHKKVHGSDCIVTAHAKADREKMELKSEYDDRTIKAEMIYAIKALGENSCHVVYTQNTSQETSSFLAKHIFQKQMKKQFGRVEKYIIEHREKENV